MPRLTLTPCADLDVFYAADRLRYVDHHPEVLALVTLEVFTRIYEGCPSIGFACDGHAIGGIIFDGQSAHIAVLPQYHGRWAQLFRRALDWLFSLKRQILVEVEADNRKCIAFMARNGWQPVHQQAGSITYLLTPEGGPGSTMIRRRADSN
jgi:GNAT superfamily N-acetyltransferase